MDENEETLADQQVPQADIRTASSRASGRAISESPTSGPRGDLAGRRLDATGVGYINMCQPKLSYGKGHFHGGTKKRIIGHCVELASKPTAQEIGC